MLSCRENDTLRITELLQHSRPLTIAELAAMLKRSVRYVHSLIAGDPRFVMRGGGKVGERVVRLAEGRQMGLFTTSD